MEPTQSSARLRSAWVMFLTSLVILAASARADDKHEHGAQSVSPEQQVQTECPVMVGNKIDPVLYTVYRDKKVFFCCQLCKTEFDKDPEKYLNRLPQFAPVSATKGPGGDEHADHDRPDARILLAQLIEPMGILTLSLVALTVALGVFRRRWRPRLMLKIHKRCGVSALVAGAVHAALVLFLH